MPKSILLALQISRDKRNKEKLILKSNKIAAEIVKGSQVINLELGSGTRKGLKGWTTIDINQHCDIYWDLKWPLPFPDNCVSNIYTSHLLEHFSYNQILNLLNECYRILKPEGIINICVPDARIYLNAYINPENFDASKYCLYKPAFSYNSTIDYVNYIAYMDGHHKYMFDIENSLIILQKTGFREVKRREFDPQLDMQERKYESIYAAGLK